MLKMAGLKLVMPFCSLIPCIYCVNVSANNALSQEYLSGSVACKTYNTSKMDCSHRHLVDIPVLDRTLTTMLDLSQNQLKEIHGAPFENLTILLNLNLSWNVISLINYTAFIGLSRLQELDLSDNRLFALPRDIFRDQFELIYLNLFVNYLFDIPSQTLATLYSLQHLHLSYVGSAFDIVITDLNSLTKLEYLQIFGICTDVTNSTFQPLLGLPIRTLHLVWLPLLGSIGVGKTAFSPFTAVKELLTDFKALPALGSLHSPLQRLALFASSEKFPYVIHNTSLKVLSKFKESLTFLELSLQNLNQVDNDTFMWIPNLISLIIWHTKVQIFAQYSFRGLTALKTLDLGNNQLTTVPSDALKVIGRFSLLECLELSSNSLSTIADDAFSGISSLTYMNLGNNKYKNEFKFIYVRWLHLLSNLTHVILGDSRISGTIAIIGLPMPLLSLQLFEIRNVGVVKFETNFCLTFPNSRSVVISSARIANFPFCLSLNECTFLKELDLSGSVEENDSLDLKNTTISIPTLEDLALARNKLTSVTQILFIKAPNLISLNLTDNQIKTIDSAIANAFKHLIHLSIDGNALISLSGLEGLINLKHINAARNQITQVPLWLISTLRFLTFRFTHTQTSALASNRSC